MIMLFGKAGLITRFLLGIYDNNVYGFWGIVIVQTLTFFPAPVLNEHPATGGLAREGGGGLGLQVVLLHREHEQGDAQEHNGHCRWCRRPLC